ncbi:hypothetical protein H0V99_00585 [Candidatus Saccharibacteria bacterium]|nr:hypothetical protein [Candidatus Saccharibacteria bacterium]
MRELGPDELFLQGRLQIATARDALSSTGINTKAESQLTTFLDVHSQLSTGEDQKDLVIYLKGGEIERSKADIVMSLELLEQSPDVQPNALEAARGLLEIIRQK